MADDHCFLIIVMFKNVRKKVCAKKRLIVSHRDVTMLDISHRVKILSFAHVFKNERSDYY